MGNNKDKINRTMYNLVERRNELNFFFLASSLSTLWVTMPLLVILVNHYKREEGGGSNFFFLIQNFEAVHDEWR